MCDGGCCRSGEEEEEEEEGEEEKKGLLDPASTEDCSGTQAQQIERIVAAGAATAGGGGAAAAADTDANAQAEAGFAAAAAVSEAVGTVVDEWKAAEGDTTVLSIAAGMASATVAPEDNDACVASLPAPAAALVSAQQPKQQPKQQQPAGQPPAGQPPVAAKLDKTVVKKMKPPELKKALKARGLSTHGNKKDLLARALLELC